MKKEEAIRRKTVKKIKLQPITFIGFFSKKEIMLEYIGHVTADLLAAIISGITLYIWQQQRYKKQLKSKFNNRKFEVRYKGATDVVRTVRCTVEKNVIKYAGYQVEKIKNESSFEGEFIIDPLNLKIGEGVHIHDEYDGFNFPRLVIRDDDTFYVETFTYPTKMKMQATSMFLKNTTKPTFGKDYLSKFQTETLPTISVLNCFSNF